MFERKCKEYLGSFKKKYILRAFQRHLKVKFIQVDSQKRPRLVGSCQFYEVKIKKNLLKKNLLLFPPGQLVNKLQQTCQFHQVATSLLRSGLL